MQWKRISSFLYSGLATWHKPTGGMFLWMNFTGLDDSFHLIVERLRKRKVLFVPGKVFIASDKPSSCARISFAFASEDEMEKVC